MGLRAAGRGSPTRVVGATMGLMEDRAGTDEACIGKGDTVLDLTNVSSFDLISPTPVASLAMFSIMMLRVSVRWTNLSESSANPDSTDLTTDSRSGVGPIAGRDLLEALWDGGSEGWDSP